MRNKVLHKNRTVKYSNSTLKSSINSLKKWQQKRITSQLTEQQTYILRPRMKTKKKQNVKKLPAITN